MRALVTGIGGQDGSYLAEQLLADGHEVFGTVLGTPADYPALEGLHERIGFVATDAARALADVEPDELYHLAAVSFVPPWWDDPIGLTRAETEGVLSLLEALRERPQTRAFFPSSSEIFAAADEEPQSETTRVAPLSPYGAMKAYVLHTVGAFRARYDLHASVGILFNHESPRRPPHFVTRKITRAAAAISRGLEDHVVLGNLDPRRDWGFAGDYTRAMQLMVRADEPGDYVVATGQAHSVREFVEAAFGAVGLDWQEYVRYDESLARGPSDARVLRGDAARARERLGWRPEVAFDELVAMMVQADLTTATYDPAA